MLNKSKDKIKNVIIIRKSIFESILEYITTTNLLLCIYKNVHKKGMFSRKVLSSFAGNRQEGEKLEVMMIELLLFHDNFAQNTCMEI